MSERLRKRIVYAALVLAIAWGAYNLSERDATMTTAAPDATVAPVARGTVTQASVPAEEISRLQSAGWGGDPFGVTQQVPRQVGQSWILRGIVYSTQSPMAYVNGRRVGIGDTVDQATVVAISRSAVTLRFQGREFDIQVQKG